MASVSVTRLHLSSPLYFVPFVISTIQIMRQVKRSTGFRGGVVGNDAQNGAWTITVWDSIDLMLKFRNTGAHMKAMARLVSWCNEASFTHWTTDADAIPSAEHAYTRLSSSGRLSKVRIPSPLHREGRTVSKDVPRFRFFLKPRKS
jgi:hypothetical protein